MFDDLIDQLAAPGGPAILASAQQPEIPRDRLVTAARSVAADLAADDPVRSALAGSAAPTLWVGAGNPYLVLVGLLGGLHAASVGLVEAEGPAAVLDGLARACPPRAVVTDRADGELARWATARDLPGHLLDPASARGRRPVRPLPSGRADSAVVFFTSGTTGPAKAVPVRRDPLLAAVRGVAGRLDLGPEDISLSIAPLTHTLGLVTGTLTGLLAGGRVVFADPRRPREFLQTFAGPAPTWCAASPSGHRLVHALVHRDGRTWPALRFLRSSSAPMPPQLRAELEGDHQVPVVDAYAMTEAPGEIASQDLAGPRLPGTVGRPTLCEVEVRADGAPVPAGGTGEVWIRGPNVAGAAPGGWYGTGDVGILDATGVLRLTGRNHDVINSGGLKIWPPDIEAAALRHPGVRAAVAFPVPHRNLGEAVGLAVVPRAGQDVDKASVRRVLMEDLPRHTWPSAIVICAEIPVSGRGKVQRRSLWRQLPGLRPTADL